MAKKSKQNQEYLPLGTYQLQLIGLEVKDFGAFLQYKIVSGPNKGYLLCVPLPEEAGAIRPIDQPIG